MPNLDLKFAVDAKALEVIDVLRGSQNREDFFRRVMEIGICELIENAARVNLDYLTQTLTGQTSEYRIVRAQLFQIGEPTTTTPPLMPDNDPHRGLVQRRETRGQP